MDRNVERELLDAGAPADLARDLATLAGELDELSGVEPRRQWLVEAKWRLLRRFDEEHAQRSSQDAEATD